MIPHSFFGYGSLVNTATHDYHDPHAAVLQGWRRVWRHTPQRPVAYLSVRPDPDSVIEGLVADVPSNDWAALDLREAAYERRDVTHQVTSIKSMAHVAVYQVTTADQLPTRTHPILLSYLDVVVQGYLHRFGTTGVANFFATTDGWNAPIRNDRAKPQYPRHQNLSPQDRAIVDDHLTRLSAQVF